MTDSDLTCNLRKCRKRIDSYAWVTSCSHVFCEEDGTREFSRLNPIKCPSCNIILPTAMDVIKVNTNPSEQFKAMVLSGLRPQIIMDIATHAISFWSFQVQMEQAYQENSIKTLREQIAKVELSYESLISKIKNQVLVLRTQIEVAKKDLAVQMKRAEELAEKLVDKTRQCQKLQAMYDAMRRSSISTSMSQHCNEDRPSCEFSSFALGPRTIAEALPQAMPAPQMPHHRPSPLHHQTFQESRQNNNDAQDGFAFRPVTPRLQRLAAFPYHQPQSSHRQQL